METKYELNLGDIERGSLAVVKLLVFEGEVLKRKVWRCVVDASTDLDVPLPCQWEGDTEQTPISLAELFPAEYQYLKAKFKPAV